MATHDDVNAGDKLSDEDLQNLLATSRKGNLAEQRIDRRFPYFAPVTLRPAAAIDRPQSAYARELSQGGMGLLHYVPFDVGQVFQIAVGDEAFNWRKRCEIMWCKPAGDGWFLSGCRFV